MIDKSNLPPHLAQFVREQLAAGRFRDEKELVRTALVLLEEQSHTDEHLHAWLKQELDRGLNGRPAEPLTPHFWRHLRRRIESPEPPDHVG